jgi:hypothetical protein
MKRTSLEHRRYFGWLLANDIDGAPSLLDWDDTVWLRDDHGSLNYSTNTSNTANALRFTKYLVNREDITANGVFDMVLLGDMPHGWTDDSHVRLPDDFVSCIRSNLYVPPTAKFDLSKLDWPCGPVGGWHPFR